MAYYLQALIGGILLLALVIPMSNNYREIKVKNIFYAILVMVLFGFLLLSDYVTGFFALSAMGLRNCLQPQQMVQVFFLVHYLKLTHMPLHSMFYLSSLLCHV